MDVHAVLGRIGLPASTAQLARRRWDVVVVGGGHNGLTAAAYLARTGRAVLVLEAREQLGGACTLERPFSDQRFVMSPCAYLVGLLHPLVVDELGLTRHGYRSWVADPASWCAFDDGTALTQWKDEGRTLDEVARLAPGAVEGWQAYWDVFRRLRRALREGPRDTWVGDAPSHDELFELVAGDAEAVEVLAGLPVADLLERHITDRRLHTALHGGGIIGTNAGPRDPGTGWIRALHELGTLGGWGYVQGGMGRVSFAIAQAALQAGAVLTTGVPVGAIRPGDGVELEDGTAIHAPVVLSNADPKRTLALLDGHAPEPFRAKVAAWRTDSPVVKLNCALSRLPTFGAAPDPPAHVYRAQVVVSAGMDTTQAAFTSARRGVPAPAWCELYFHTAYDRSVAPDGAHTMSAFCQYVPYRLAEGSWDTRRDEVAGQILSSIARVAPDIADCVLEWQLLAPPDVEARIGLSGGHIFQGECLPDQMWEQRFAARTPVAGLYLCGAATHPAGSVIAVNGRNAAAAVLTDLGESAL